MHLFYRQLDGLPVFLPFISSFTIDSTGFRPSGTNIGPTVSFGTYSLIVTIPDVYKTHTCGICGNFNDDKTDDMKTANGADKSGVANKGRYIGDSYVDDL